MDGGHGPGDLAGDEGLAPRRALMVEQDPVRGVDAIGLAVIDRDPIAVELGRRIGAARHEGRRLALGGGRAAVKLGCGGLIEAGDVLALQNADRFQQAQRAQGIGIGGVFGRLEAHLDMALGRQVVDLVGLGFLDQANQIGRVRQIAVMEEEAHALLMAVHVEMIDAAGVEGGRPALHAMNDIALGQQQCRQICAVLAGDARDKCDLLRHDPPARLLSVYPIAGGARSRPVRAATLTDFPSRWKPGGRNATLAGESGV